MLGIVAALFCTLIVAGLCSYFFKLDFKWYNLLNKPSFLLGGGWFTVFVAISYVSSILSISRLVEGKHLFPSMIFFALLGLFCVLFVLCFFYFKNIFAGFVFITFTLSMSYTLFVRFLIKDYKIAIEFAPTLIFHIYCFLCVTFIALNN